LAVFGYGVAMTITRKVTLSLILAGLAVVCLVSALRYHAGTLLLSREFADLQQRIARRLSVSLPRPLFELNWRAAQDTLAAEFSRLEIEAIVVWSPDRTRILCGWQRTPDGLEPARDRPQREPGSVHETTLIHIADDGERRAMGVLAIHLAPEVARHRLRLGILREMLITGLSLSLLVILAAWLMREAVATPLDNLRHRLQAVEAAAACPDPGETWPRLVAPTEDPTFFGAFAELREMAGTLGRMLQNLWDREESLRITLNSIGDAVIATDERGIIRRINPVAETLTGWSRQEAVGRPLTDVFRIVHGSTRAPVENPVQKVLARGEVVGLATPSLLLARDGREHQVADSGAPIRDRHGQTVGVVLVFRDVTEQQALETQLRQAQKMDAIGQMAGGIVHDFNNLLSGMMGSAELLAARMAPDDPGRRFVETIMQTGRTATDLARKLLTFARRDRGEMVPLDLHKILRDVGNLLEHSLPRQVILRFDLQAPRPTLMGNAADLQSVFLNLCLNARDAMPHGGILTIASRTLAIMPGERLDGVLPLSVGEYLSIEVTDTGVGIPPEQMEHLFEPFFTTKGSGQGTGLGLSAVYGAVKRHRGSVRVSSMVGRGTTFQILLPQGGVALPAPAARAPEGTPIRGTGLILVVEDEESLRLNARDMLESLGYQVRVAENGAAGLAALLEAPSAVKAVLMDLVMPVMDGRTLLLELRQRGFLVPIVVVSGANPPADLPTLLAGHGTFLPKPYSLASLSRALALVTTTPAAAPACATPAPPPGSSH
jgi:PAS domain S-box-containing protein